MYIDYKMCSQCLKSLFNMVVSMFIMILSGFHSFIQSLMWSSHFMCLRILCPKFYVVCICASLCYYMFMLCSLCLILLVFNIVFSMFYIVVRNVLLLSIICLFLWILFKLLCLCMMLAQCVPLCCLHWCLNILYVYTWTYHV